MTVNEKQVDLRADISGRKPLTLEPFQVRPHMPTQANSTSRGDIQRRHSYTEENIIKILPDARPYARPYMPNQANSTSRGLIQRRHSYTEENINKTLLTTNTTNAFCGRNSI